MNPSFVSPFLKTALAVALVTPAAFSEEIFLSPGDSIQDAIDGASAGSTIHLSPGTYTELIDLKGKALTVRGDGGAAATILSGAGLGGSVVRCVSGEGRDTVLESLCIADGQGSMSGADLVGGGMLCDGSSPLVRSCIFLNNTVDNTFFALGGAVFADGGAPCFDACQFMNNYSSGRGGAVLVDDTEAILVNCQLRGNIAGLTGGAMESKANLGLVPTVVHCTFVENDATNGGSAIGLDESAEVVVAGALIWGNFGPGSPIGGDVSGASVRWSNVEGGFSGTGNIDADPLFVDSLGGNFDLSLGSPCIDAGDSMAFPAGIDADFLDRPRFCDDASTADTGNTDGSRAVADIGAFEISTAVWTDLGFGLAGQGGLVPQLDGQGGLCAGDLMQLDISNARANSIGFLFLGLDRVDLPLLGGTLVPRIDFMMCCLATDAAGELSLAFTVPDVQFPPATYFQLWILDDGGPRGVSATNGLQVSPQ